jgi:uncharacterized membrane protein
MGWCCNGLGWGSWAGMGTIGMIVNAVFLIGGLALLGLVIAWLVRQVNRRPASAVPMASGDPLEIARRRLASGEITIAEFEEIRDRLQS